ncbi:hypothetical protein BAY59_38525 (plasmid) [Prauserella coralliicola]|nr:hypothetical protein BAY59_38525 [Prauserella coralliicola]
MPMLSVDERCEWQPDSRADFVMWWLPEFAAAAGCICAGLLLWGPLAVAAVVPLMRPGGHLIHLAAAERREVEAERARIVAAELADRQQLIQGQPIVAQAERLDQQQLGEAER